MKHKFLLLYAWWIRTVLLLFPDIPFVMRFRGFLYSFGMPTSGKNFQVSANVIIKNLENFHVGKDVYLAPFVVVNAIDDIVLENEVMIGFSSILVSGNHTRIDGSFRYGKSQTSPVNIGYGSWVGANCTIVAGGNLPLGSLLAANSVISKPLRTENAIYGGVPAKLISKLES